MDSTAVTIFNELVKQYEGSFALLKPNSIICAKETYTNLALITVAWTFISHLLKKGVDAVEANMEFIRTFIFLYLFFLLIWNYDSWLPLIFQTFKNVGQTIVTVDYGGGNIANSIKKIDNPGEIINAGWSIAGNILDTAKKAGGLTAIGLWLVAVGCSAVILFCFGRIAVELVLIDIGSRIILLAGIFMLGFAGSAWTRPYAEKYIAAMFNVGIKMMFVYMLIGIGLSLTNGWASLVASAPPDKMIETYVAVVMATFVYYMLCLRLPDIASSMLSGSFSLGFGAGDANVRSVLMGGAAVAAGMVAMGKAGGGAVATHVVGSARAWTASKTLTQNQGATNGATRTLGAAKNMVQAAGAVAADWAKTQARSFISKADTTYPGTLGQKIKERHAAQMAGEMGKEFKGSNLG